MIQCDKCNEPVDWNDEGIYVSETKIYCKICVEKIESKYSFMDKV